MQVNSNSNLVDYIISNVLPIYDPIPQSEREIIFIPMMNYEPISEAVRDFNPETHVIITKAEFDLRSDLKALAGAVKSIDELQETQKNIAVWVEELHSVQTGKYLNPKTAKPTKAEVEKIRLQKLYNQGLQNVLNRK